jgi:hypothetical protein
VTGHHPAHVLQALLVTFLWSTSWVLIKIGLVDIPALTFAGLRYALATLVLLPFVLRGDRWRPCGGSRTRLARPAAARPGAVRAHPGGPVPGPGVPAGRDAQPRPVVLAAGGGAGSPVGRCGVARAAAVARASPWSRWAPLTYFGPTLPPVDQRVGLVIALVGLAPTRRAACSAARSTAPARWTRCWSRSAAWASGSAVLLATGLATQGLPSLSTTSVAARRCRRRRVRRPKVDFSVVPLLAVAALRHAGAGAARTEPVPVGAANLVRLLRDDALWQSLGTTLAFAADGAAGLPALSVVIALAIEGVRYERFIKALLFAPGLVTVGGSAIAWYLLYNPDFGCGPELTGSPAVDLAAVGGARSTSSRSRSGSRRATASWSPRPRCAASRARSRRPPASTAPARARCAASSWCRCCGRRCCS